MKRILSIFALVGTFMVLTSITHSAFAQSKVSISGSVKNDTDQPLIGSTVVLLQSADSVLVSFAMTDNQGNFEIKRVASGKYILQISYLGFEKTNKNLTIQADQGDIAIGTINLKSTETMLEQVDIEGQRTPIFIRKDTIEYTADAFEVKPNATVEDLLKKMPGIEVEQDGTVTAQGEEVQKILVDGKEFFGQDPKIATKNLPAEVVDKVQVFDQKSENAQFTGIDDGQEQKAINLQLKDDKKKGMFGKVEAGAGTENTYEVQGNMNRFNKKLQLSLIGQLNNTNNQGFSFDDYVSFMGGMQRAFAGGGGFRGGGTTGLPISQGPNYGFRTTGAGGLNFNYEFSKKTNLNISYFYNYYKNEQDAIAFRETILQRGSFFTEDSTSETSITNNNRLNLYFQHKIDSSQEMSLRSSVTFNAADIDQLQIYENQNIERVTENLTTTDYQSEGNRTNFSNELNYRKKLNSKGRSLSATFTLGGSDNTQDAFLNSLTAFPRGNLPDSLINQDQNQVDDQLNYSIRLSYTEPLKKRQYMTFDYRKQNNRNNLDKEFYDIDPTDFTRVFNELFSNQYKRDFNYDRGGVSYRLVRDNFNFNVGAEVQQTSLDGEWITRDTMINRQNTQFLPNFRFSWDLAKTRNIRIDYRTSVQEPSMDQLQPVPDLANPLNVYVGNPELQPEYRHRASLRFFSFSQFTQTSIFANLSATYTTEKISNTQTIDENFRQITTPINVDDDLRLTAFGSVSFQVKDLGSRIRLNSNISFNRGTTFFNGVDNDYDRFTTSGGITLNNANTEVWDISAGLRLSHSTTSYSINTERNQTFLNQTYFADIIWYITPKFNINTAIDYAVYSNEAFTDQQAIPIWKAGISHYVLKNNRGEIKFTVNDILNRNLGVNRTANLNYVEEERITSLARYAMLSFVYNLSQFPGSTGGRGPSWRMRRERR